MSPFPVLFAAEWQDKLKEIQSQVQEYNDQVPDYLAKAGVPTLEKMPEMNIAADFILILAAIALFVTIWRLLTLRIFRFLFALIATVLIAYYPVAYGFHWWLFKYDAAAKAEREEVPAWEQKIHDNLRFYDYGIMAGGVLIGGTLLLLTRRSRDDEEERTYEDSGQQAPWHQPTAERQRGQQQSGKNPFDFSGQ
jgi:hypothetical protein